MTLEEKMELFKAINDLLDANSTLMVCIKRLLPEEDYQEILDKWRDPNTGPIRRKYLDGAYHIQDLKEDE